jgi:hypothetical protein
MKEGEKGYSAIVDLLVGNDLGRLCRLLDRRTEGLELRLVR